MLYNAILSSTQHTQWNHIIQISDLGIRVVAKFFEAIFICSKPFTADKDKNEKCDSFIINFFDFFMV